MRAIEAESEVYLWRGNVDMRAGFDRLAQLVQTEQARSVMTGGLYVFISRCRKRVKILYWDNDGYALWYKRLEAGALKVSKQAGVEQLSGIDLKQLLMGVDLSRIKLKKSVENGLYS